MAETWKNGHSVRKCVVSLWGAGHNKETEEQAVYRMLNAIFDQRESLDHLVASFLPTVDTRSES